MRHALDARLLTPILESSAAGGTSSLVVDPINSFSMNVLWSLDVRWTSSVTINLTQRLLISAQDDIQKGPFDPWQVGTQRGRSETGLRISYAF